MLLVPVLDIRHGQVVRAVRGERAAYRPVQSRLVAGSEPVAVAHALLDAAGSDTLYIADLDALLGEAPQADLLRRLRDALPGVALWLDAGFRDAASARAQADALGRATPVLGTESLRSRQALAGRSDVILSLDQHHGRALDSAGWWDDADLWPQQVIAMTLDRVGADSGPDLALLQQLRQRAPQRRFIGAGGIRDDADLQACAVAGAHAWLVASALHERRLRGGTRLATGNAPMTDAWTCPFCALLCDTFAVAPRPRRCASRAATARARMLRLRHFDSNAARRRHR